MIGFTTLFGFFAVIQKMDDTKTYKNSGPLTFFVSPFNVLVPQISFITSQPLPPVAAWQQAAEGESTLESHHPPINHLLPSHSKTFQATPQNSPRLVVRNISSIIIHHPSSSIIIHPSILQATLPWAQSPIQFAARGPAAAPAPDLPAARCSAPRRATPPRGLALWTRGGKPSQNTRKNWDKFTGLPGKIGDLTSKKVVK